MKPWALRSVLGGYEQPPEPERRLAVLRACPYRRPSVVAIGTREPDRPTPRADTHHGTLGGRTGVPRDAQRRSSLAALPVPAVAPGTCAGGGAAPPATATAGRSRAATYRKPYGIPFRAQEVVIPLMYVITNDHCTARYVRTAGTKGPTLADDGAPPDCLGVRSGHPARSTLDVRGVADVRWMPGALLDDDVLTAKSGCLRGAKERRFFWRCIGPRGLVRLSL